MRISMPMMSDRDNVIQIQFKDIDGGTFMSMHTVEHALDKPDPKVIRMFNHAICFLKQEGNDVTMTDFEYFNLRGYLPASLLNMTIASETSKEFTSMMKHIYTQQKAWDSELFLFDIY